MGAGAQIRAADSVLLVGAAVANYGNISAADGMIALVAGGEVRLARVDGRVIVTADRALAPDPERWGVVQAGTLDAGRGSVSLTAGDAYSLAINHTGITRARDIAVAGGDGGIVSVSGALDASDRSAGATGGAIAVTGDRVALLGAQLDASGDAGGGSIRVGGDLRGEGELPTAQRTYVDETSALRADAITTGDGGTIIVWSDEATRFYGALSARGGALGGDGGFAEISGASLASRGSIDLGASAGSAGTLLYDPKDILLVGGAAPVDGSDDPDTAADQLVGSSAGQVLFGTPDELLTPFDDLRVGDRGHGRERDARGDQQHLHGELRRVRRSRDAQARSLAHDAHAQQRGRRRASRPASSSPASRSRPAARAASRSRRATTERAAAAARLLPRASRSGISARPGAQFPSRRRRARSRLAT